MKLICAIWFPGRKGGMINILTKEIITMSEFWNNTYKYQDTINYEPSNLKQILNEN